jgi:hypothetical protein
MLYAFSSCNNNCIIFNFVNRSHNFHLHLFIKQPGKA